MLFESLPYMCLPVATRTLVLIRLLVQFLKCLVYCFGSDPCMCSWDINTGAHEQLHGVTFPRSSLSLCDILVFSSSKELSLSVLWPKAEALFTYLHCPLPPLHGYLGPSGKRRERTQLGVHSPYWDHRYSCWERWFPSEL